MKRATQATPDLELKNRKGIKLFSALAMVLPAFLESGQKTFAITHVNKAPKMSVVIDKSMGKHQMATVRSVNGSENIHDGWHASIAGKRTRVYCLEPMKGSPSKNTTAYKAGNASADVRAVLRAGFGLNTAEELGHPGQAAACEYGTQVAVWRVAGAISPNISWHNKTAKAVYDYIMSVYKQKKFRGDGLTRMYIHDLDKSTNSSVKKTTAKKSAAKTTKKAATAKKSTKTKTTKAKTAVQPNAKAVKTPKATKKAKANTTSKKTTSTKKTVQPVNKTNKQTVTSTISFGSLKLNAATKKTAKKSKTPVTTARTKHLEVVTSENGRPISLDVNLKASNITVTQGGKKVTKIKSNKPFTAKLNNGANTGSIKVTTTAYATDAVIYRPSNGTQSGVSLLAVKNKKLSDSYKWNQPLTPQGNTVGTGEDYEVVPAENSVSVSTPAPQTETEVETPKTTTPTANTKLTNLQDGKQVIQQSKGSVTLNEQVSMNGLKSGEKYKVNSWLVDQASGKPALVNGKQVSGTTDYTANSESGTVNVKITIPEVSGFVGKKLVAFTDVNVSGKTGNSYIKHEDLKDESETVSFTKASIHTTATGDNGSKVITPSGNEKIIDKVSYEGLIPGEKYVVKGVLMDKSTNKPVTNNGKQITGTAEFTAQSTNGSVNVPFTFNANNYRNKRLVVFETLYHANSQIAEHKDINDQGQSVDVNSPELHTTLTANSQKVVTPSESNKVIDEVRYQGLTLGQTYQIQGRLMDKTTGLPVMVNGNAVRSTATFTAKKANGSIELPFKFNGKEYVGHQLVAYEDLYVSGKEVAKHEVKNDTAQTVLIQKKTPAPLKTPASGNTAPTKSETVLPTTDSQDNIVMILVGVGIVISVLGVVFVKRNQTTGLD